MSIKFYTCREEDSKERHRLRCREAPGETSWRCGQSPDLPLVPSQDSVWRSKRPRFPLRGPCSSLPRVFRRLIFSTLNSGCGTSRQRSGSGPDFRLSVL